MYWEEQHTAGYVIHNDRIYIVGGGRCDTPASPSRVFFNNVLSSADGVHWKLHKQCHVVAVFDNRHWVLEGWNSKNRSDVWYSENGDQ
mgnify:CR=1 FL=1|tara:strand:- start:14 stop:277 length:264 start_codon:yes stop_codon:yes gene_type:complete